MATPEIRFVVWGSQDAAPIEADWRALLAASVLDRLAEYGVRGGTLGATVRALPDQAPGIFPDGWVLERLIEQVAPLGITPNSLYVVVLPPGSSTTALTAEHATGYHFWGAFPYAVVTYDNVLISHEVYEAATDPFGLGVKIGAEEVGDMCEGRYSHFAGVEVQQFWSVEKGECL